MRIEIEPPWDGAAGRAIVNVYTDDDRDDDPELSIHLAVPRDRWRLGFDVTWYDGPLTSLDLGPLVFAWGPTSAVGDWLWERLARPAGWSPGFTSRPEPSTRRGRLAERVWGRLLAPKR